MQHTDPDFPAAVVARFQALPKRATRADYVPFIEWIFRARGYQMTAHDKWSVDAEHRYEIGTQVLRYQERDRDGAGRATWRPRGSWSFRDAALGFYEAAAKKTGQAADVASAHDAKMERRDEQSRARVKRLDAEARARAFEVVIKRLAALHPADMFAMAQGQKIPEDRAAVLREQQATDLAMLTMLAKAGSPMPGDGEFVSADAPPFLPLYRRGTQYLWTATQDGHAFSVLVAYRQRGIAQIVIGDPGMVGALQVNALGVSVLSLAELRRSGAVHGPGFVTGEIRDVEGDRVGVLVQIGAKSKRAGIGRAALRLWCRLMRGYDATHWVAVGVGEEGAAFFRALAARDEIVVREARPGAPWIVQCGKGS